MRPADSPGWKAKLPSAALALAVQGAFFALLAFSFTVATRTPQTPPQEVIFLLPRPTPKPLPKPVTIDARPKAQAAGAPPPVATSLLPPSESGNGITALPGTAKPPSDAQLLQALGRAGNCQPDEKGQVSALCLRAARPDPNALVLGPPDHVKKSDQWAAEKARNDGPIVLPGGNPLGILITALTDPGAFLDKRNYQPPPPPKVAPQMTWGDREYLRRYTSPQCPPGMGTDFDRRQCSTNAAALGKD